MASIPFASEPNNHLLNDELRKLNGYGITQEQLAARLGISPGQLSRIRKGERRATSAHVRTLGEYVREVTESRQSQGVKVTTSVQPALSLDAGVLDRLSPQEAVGAFRDLLWARAAARRVPSTIINISARVFTADGGIDSTVVRGRHSVPLDDDLLGNDTGYQIKTGEIKLWQKAVLKRELFGNAKKAVTRENLGASVRNTLSNGRRLIFVCFGIDPTPDDQLVKITTLAREFLGQCGFPDAEVDVWGQSKLIGLFNDYPSLCLRLSGHIYKGFRTHESWSGLETMLPGLCCGPEQLQLMQELRAQILSGQVGHVRLLGEPGVGKTRMALEITRDERLAPLTLYVREGRDILQSTFLNELIQQDDRRNVVFVVDECSYRDATELWDVLKSKSDRVQLVTIDHGPDKSVDDRTEIVPIQPLGEEEMIAILMGYGLDKSEARRWAGLCDGCPRVAHVVGENLRGRRDNVLQTPGIVDVWNRFIEGSDGVGGDELEFRKVVLRCIALFERFGYKWPVECEGDFIADLVSSMDSRITRAKFQSIVRTLHDRKILQGNTTLYITPRLLHIHLFREFWDFYGDRFEIASAMSEMPSPLWAWFVKMLKYAHDVESAERAIDTLLDDPTLFPHGNFPSYGDSGRIVEVLAETTPKSVLKCLARTVGEMDIESLRKLEKPRQLIVWALERIAVWRDQFLPATRLLRKLAVAENSKMGNNATEIFQQCFSLNPGLAGTEAEPKLRLAVLSETLNSESLEERRLGVSTCVAALNTQMGFRTVGAEYQGIRPTVEFWFPKTYGDLWSAQKDVWELLEGKRKSWAGDEKAELNSALIRVAWHMLYTPSASSVLATLRSIAVEPETDISALVELIKRQVRHKDTKLSADIVTQLQEIHDGLEVGDFATQLRRFVKFAAWEDFYDDDRKASSKVNDKIDELASMAVESPNLLLGELKWLVTETSNVAYHFGYKIAERDRPRTFLQPIIDEYKNSAAPTPELLGGYLRSVFVRDVERWEEVIADISEIPSISIRLSDYVIGSGMTDHIALKVVEHCRTGKQKIDLLERWWFDSQMKSLAAPTVIELVNLHLADERGSTWSNAVDLCHTYYMDGDVAAQLPEELLLRLLLRDSMADGNAAAEAGYHWGRLTKAFLEQYPHRKWEFFGRLLRAGRGHRSVIDNLNTESDLFLTEMIRSDPERAFGVIKEVFEDGRELRSYSLNNWLSRGGHHAWGDESPGPIQYIPSRVIFEWIDGDIENRGSWVAHLLPKTLDNSAAGRLTRDFIARYGNNERLMASLRTRFSSRAWSGKESDYCSELRVEARSWLVDETNANVMRWVGNYIDGLSADIRRALVQEERDF